MFKIETGLKTIIEISSIILFLLIFQLIIESN